ncbi:MAG: HNH endonuclease [Bacteroidales bacterium]
MANRNWTKEELILAFNLYLKLPFGKFHQGNPEVQRLATLINRTPSSVAMRLSNFASLDPYHQQRGVIGLKGGAKQCQPIWDEFNENREELIFQSEKILAEKENQTLEKKHFKEIEEDFKEGKDKTRQIKTRVNQNVFREIVLNNYTTQCAISGIDIPDLLNASHIIPWSENKKERLNPSNGICLSKLYDAAFDKGFIGIKPDYSIIISSKLTIKKEEPYYNRFFSQINGMKIHLPEKYYPSREFLEYHLDEVFKG